MLLVDNKPFVIPATIREKFTQKAVFVVNPNKILWDDLNQRIDVPAGEGIPVSYSAYLDLEDGQGRRMVKVRYYDAERAHPTHATQMLYEPPWINMPGCFLEIFDKDYEMNWFLQNHTNNGKNPERGNNRWIFQTFDMDAIRKTGKERFLIKLKAMSYIEGDDQRDFHELKAVAREIENDRINKLDHGIVNSPDMTEDELRFAMQKVAEKYPVELMNYFSMSKTIIRNDIENYKAAGILEYVGGEAGNVKGRWMMHTDEEKQPVIEICSVFKGKEPGDVITEFLKDEDKKNIYKRLQSLYKKKAAATV